MDRKDHKTLSCFLAVLIFFVGCKKDKPDGSDTSGAPSVGNNVYVVCEGSLGNGNAALSMYDTKAGIAYDDVYKSNNNNQSLGDVFQSMQLIEGKFFLCVNNSDKVVALDRNTLKLSGTIDIPKPRYVLNIKPTKGYVSTLFSNKVYIIDPHALSVTGTITMPYQNPEGMLLYNGKAFVCTWDTACNKIYKINIVADSIEQAINVAGAAPQEILDDAYGRLWVLSGNVAKGKAAALTCIDPVSGSIIKSFNFPAGADPIRPVFNDTKDELYFIEVNYTGGTAYNGIFRMSVNDASLPTQPFIAAKQYQYFWALGIEPGADKIYVGDPKGFTQKGSVSVYDLSGNPVNQFNVGLGPGHFYFDK